MTAVLVGAVLLVGLGAAAVGARYVFVHGEVGARRAWALLSWMLTETVAGKLLTAACGSLLAVGSISVAMASGGWGSRAMSGVAAIFWSVMTVRWLLNGWRLWASQRDGARKAPEIEHIPE